MMNYCYYFIAYIIIITFLNVTQSLSLVINTYYYISISTKRSLIAEICRPSLRFYDIRSDQMLICTAKTFFSSDENYSNGAVLNLLIIYNKLDNISHTKANQLSEK